MFLVKNLGGGGGGGSIFHENRCPVKGDIIMTDSSERQMKRKTISILLLCFLYLYLSSL